MLDFLGSIISVIEIDPLPYEFVMVDELSMVDTETMAMLLQAVGKEI